MHFDVIIPARNEAGFIVDIVTCVKDWPEVARAIVVDNASDDDTNKLAVSACADVVEEPRIGKGYAVQRGFRAATSDLVFVCDADVRGLSREKVLAAVRRVATGNAELCRLAMRRPAEAAPVTTLLAVPLLRHLFPGLSLEEPIGGIFAMRRREALALSLPNDWGFDVALTLAIADKRGKIEEMPAPELTHRARAVHEYQTMAFEVAQAILGRANRLGRG